MILLTLKTVPVGQWHTVQPSSSHRQTSSAACPHTSRQCQPATGSPWSWPERKGGVEEFSLNCDHSPQKTTTTVCDATFLETHHAGEGEQSRLDLRHVAILKQIIGLEDIMGLQAVHCESFDEVCQVLQLKPHQSKQEQQVLSWSRAIISLPVSSH